MGNKHKKYIILLNGKFNEVDPNDLFEIMTSLDQDAWEQILIETINSACYFEAAHNAIPLDKNDKRTKRSLFNTIEQAKKIDKKFFEKIDINKIQDQADKMMKAEMDRLERQKEAHEKAANMNIIQTDSI